jgi:phosphatidylethanolamine/phosphatidyl-N-methylethanolamine N-methyltransferase
LKTTFFFSYLKTPGMVGSVLPSSRHLATSLCRHARGAKHLVELGAGTGAITSHLSSTFKEVPLFIVERDEAMASRLEHRFKGCRVIGECLHERPEILQGLPNESTIVSSLPFLSLPKEVAQRTIALITDFLIVSPHRKFIQYTYGRSKPFDATHASLAWTRHERILLNFPPARVWTLQLLPSLLPETLQ